MRAVPGMLAICAALAACADSERSAGAEARTRPLVFAVNLPLATFAERIGGAWVEVRFPAPPGIDPADWMPSDDVLAEAQSADLILANGAGYGRWLETASLPSSRVVVTAEAFSARWIERAGETVHQHGPAGEHSHPALAPTTWLDLTLAAEQARAVAAALAARLPGHAAEFEDALAGVVEELEGLDARWRAAAELDPGRPLCASHPVYPYLARRLSLNLRSVHWEPDEEPGEQEWQALASLLAEHPARTMLWEREPLAATAERLRAMGVASLVFDPAGGLPADARPAGFFDRMRANAASLELAFAPEPGTNER